MAMSGHEVGISRLSGADVAPGVGVGGLAGFLGE